MFAKNRCHVASFSLRCLRLSKRFCKKSQNRCTLRLEFICKGKIGTTMTHIQMMLKCQLVELCVLFFKFWIMCAFTWYNCTWHLFHQSKLKAVAHLSSLSTWYLQADPALQAPHHRCHPETPGGGPLPPSSCRVWSAPRCESSARADLHEQPGGASAAAGKAGWGGAEVFGWREVTFLEDASLFWFDQGLRPAFSSCFPVLLKRCDKWFIYAIIYHRCRVFCLYMYLLLFPTPPDHVPTLGKISWKYSIVTLYHTLKRAHQTWRIFKIHYTRKELRGFWSHQQDSVANRIQWRRTK